MNLVLSEEEECSEWRPVGKVWYYQRDRVRVHDQTRLLLFILRSLYNKEPEFRAWLVEERMINPETISKDQTKKEFAKFAEDFNTATLPHEKFYNIASYEMRMAALRSGEYVPPQDDGYDPHADMRALQGAHKRKPRTVDTYMSREQLMELRKVQAERIEAGKMKLLGMDIKQNMGVRMDGTMFDD
ncbi:hypothetical protein BDW22DRAFT_1328241 [Trametopsis cervina]|nr:hypothetical protein BDW22DRAFT_1328241 [Trametopsis cervina]